MTRKTRCIAILLIVLLLQFVGSLSFAFEESDIALCQADPLHCITGEPNPQITNGSRIVEVDKFERPHVKLVLFGTNRKLNNYSDDNQLYKISGSFSNEISEGMIKGVIEETVNEDGGITSINSAYMNIFSMDYDAADYLNSIGNGGAYKSFIYVHGVNNDFESAITDASILSDSSSNKIIPFVFSWPSHLWGKFESISTRAYDRDKSRNEESIPSFFNFINYVRSITGNDVDIFAHSRGSYLVSRVIERLYNRRSISGIVRSVTFAAPDMDSIIFYDLLSQIISDMNYQFTVYVNAGDRVLAASQWKNYCIEIQNSILKSKLGFLDIIDVDGMGSITGHDFFLVNVNVASDYREWLISHVAAVRRSLLARTDEFRYRLKKP